MNTNTPLDEANNLTVQRFIRHYLPPGGAPIRTIDGACVVTRKIGNRHGVLPDAETYRYEITHPDCGFAISIRAVWRCGDLMRPVATHTTIEDYENVGDHGSDHAVRAALNEWLQSLAL